MVAGDSFMVRYFPDTLAEMTSNPPDISAEEQKKLTMEASTWLKAQLLKAAKKVGWQQLVSITLESCSLFESR